MIGSSQVLSLEEVDDKGFVGLLEPLSESDPFLGCGVGVREESPLLKLDVFGLFDVPNFDRKNSDKMAE